jgi:hypothetical protein
MRFSIAFAILLLSSNAAGEVAPVGACDSTGPTEKRAVEFNSESRHDSESEFAATLSCSTEIIRIRHCAIVTIRNQKVQHFCFPDNKPAYYEYSDVIEYQESASKTSTTEEKPGTHTEAR